MNFLGAGEETFSAYDEKTLQCDIFTFLNSKEDYFLKKHAMWDSIEGNIYTVKIGGSVFKIPAGVYILCGDFNMTQDWLMIDELFYKDVCVVCMNRNMKRWAIENVELDTMDTGKAYIPFCKNPIPVASEDGKRVIVVSTTDQYHQLKDATYDIFFL